MAYSHQTELVVGGADASEYLVDATAMYDLGESISMIGETWSVGAGYTFDRADGEDVQIVGLRLSSEFSKSIPLGN